MSFLRSDYIATYNLCVMVYRLSDRRSANAQRAQDLAHRVEAAAGQLGKVPADLWHTAPTGYITAVLTEGPSQTPTPTPSQTPAKRRPRK